MTGNHFDRIAEYYDVLHDGVDYPAECNLLERVFSRFLGGRPVTILDLGCGTGNHALELASRGYQVTGINASPGMVRVARKKARGRTKATFVKGDMRRFDLGHTFDAAMCLDGAFTHLLTDRDLLAHLRKALARAGMQIVRFFSTDEGSGLRPLRKDDPLPMAVAQPARPSNGPVRI